MRGQTGIDSATVALPLDVDGLEIAGCVEFDDGFVEAVAPGDPADFYTVYWHLSAGGVDALEDFGDVEDARQFAAELSKRFALTVHDFA